MSTVPAGGLVIAFVLGAMVGSFLNVVIFRLPRGESIVHPRSRCPGCERTIAAWNNIPILSWLLLRGRCASCGIAISPRYPVIELLTGVLWCAVVARSGLTPAAVAGVILASSCLAIAFIDIDIWEIPDEISLPNIAIGILLRPWAFDAPWYDGIAGAAAGAFLLFSIRWAYLKFRGVEGMGLGDVKLIAMLGAYLGLMSILPIVLVASVSGAVIGGLLLLIRGPQSTEPKAPPTTDAAATAPDHELPPSGNASEADEDDWVPPATAVPFGPFLALGGLAELLMGPLVHVLSLRSLGIL